VPRLASITRRISAKQRLLSKTSFALLLCTLWLGLTAGSAAVLTSLNNDTDVIKAAANEPANKITQRNTRTIAEGPYRTWDDVATAPLPGDAASNRSTSPPLSGDDWGDESGDKGMVRRPVRRKADKQDTRKKRRTEQQRRKRNKIKHDPASVVDL
jgi:hypothetical protein